MKTVTFSASFRAFLREAALKGNSVARLLTRYYELSDYYPVWHKAITNAEVDFLTVRDNGLISFLPAGKEHKVNERGEWSREGRQEGKPGKVIRKLFTEKALRFMTAQSFEQLGNQYKSKFTDNGFQFIMRPRTDIQEVYNMERANGGGPLNDSCMNGDDYMEIYEKCKAVQILTLVNKSEKLCGRALVWNVNHKKHGDITFMDRLYCVEDYMTDMFLDYARDNKWWRKRNYVSQDNKMTWINPATDESETMSIRFNTDTDCKMYPYIDTFCYGDDGWLTNSSSESHTYQYQETGGSREGGEDDHEDEAYDEIEDQYISQDNAVYLCSQGERQYRDRTTHLDNAVEVYVSGRSTDWFHKEDCNIVEVKDPRRGWVFYYTQHDDIICKADCEHDLQVNCIECETDGEWYDKDDSDIMESGGSYYHKETDDNVIWSQTDSAYYYLPHHEGEFVEATDGNWYSKDDESITQTVANREGTWFVINRDAPKMIVDVDGKWYDRCDVADVTVYGCDDKGREVRHTEYYLQKDKRIKFVESIMGKDHHKELGWYLKTDLIKWRNKYYHKDDQRLLVRVMKSFTTTKRKAQVK